MRKRSEKAPRGPNLDHAMAAYAILLFLSLAANIETYLNINDEVTYMLMADTISKGRLDIWNGADEMDSDELVFHATFKQGGRTYGVPSPMYQLLALPFYLALGVRGLILMNTFSFAGTTLVVYHMSKSLFESGRLAALTAVFYSIISYSMKYSLDLWPHMISVFLVSLSAWLILRCRPWVAGLAMGFAVSIRYSNILLLGVLGAYALARSGRVKTVRFLLGSLPPAAATLLMLRSIHGTFSKTGYNPGQSIIEYLSADVKPYLLILAAASLISFAFARRMRGLRAGAIAGLSCLLMLSILFTFEDPGFTDKAISSLRILCSEVVDMQSHPDTRVPHRKKSLLQASPILALALLAPPILRKRVGLSGVFLLYAPFSSLALFYSSYPLKHGGSVMFMRYFLEAVPFLAIASAYALSSMARFGSVETTASKTGLAVIVFTMLGPLQGLSADFAGFFLRFVPLTLAASLIVSGAAAHHGRRCRRLFHAALILTVAYSISSNVVDTTVTKKSKAFVGETLEDLDVLEEGSTVFVGEDTGFIAVGQLKKDRGIRLVQASIDGFNDSQRTMEHYVSSGVPVNVVEVLFINNTEYRRFIESNLSMYSHSQSEGEYLRVYHVSK
ncbi:MAG: hypothetical protein GF416_04145 [Candidatus Altiarchaeales archaeon]|nr:hypothetical protein [Candidatus Altiarchaeales archaeon]MBD3416311.1 hypothetical protein [Candidatus Altiarchaeales archaeon]